MEHRPVIGLTGRWDNEQQKCFVPDDYLRAVEAAGGVPALIPLAKADEPLANVPGWARIEDMDGFVLCGNPSDIDPARYGQQRHPQLGKIEPERDQADWRILEHAFRARKPVLGICFGLQSLNVYRGGTLLQDIPAQVPGALQHDDCEGGHVIALEGASRLFVWAGGRTEVRVNSTHHQAAEKIGEGLRLAARAPDGVIEAVEGEDPGHFVIGVQWHPERIWKTEALSARLFVALTGAAASRRLNEGKAAAGAQAMVDTLP